MLSIINAAETQFRHESEIRMREHALLASIRERRAAEATFAPVGVAPSRDVGAISPARDTRSPCAAPPRSRHLHDGLRRRLIHTLGRRAARRACQVPPPAVSVRRRCRPRSAARAWSRRHR